MDKNLNETPTLAQVLKDAIEARLADVHVSLPGKVLSYDADKQKAKVQLEIKRLFVSGKSVDLPVLTDVPVAWPRAGNAYLHLPLKPGHQVQVVFSERSLDEWKVSGGSVSPKERRKFSLSDGWCVPGGYPFNNTIAGDTSDVTLVNDKTEFRLTPGGKMSFKGQSGEEFLLIMYELLAILEVTTTNTIFGPMKLNEFVQIGLLKKRLEKLKI